MHELAVTQTILKIALEHAPQGARISDLYLVVGELSSMVDDSVQFYWDMIAEGTAAQGARLHFERRPAQMICGECGAQFSPLRALACPDCGGQQARLAAGEEFYLEAIEVQRETPGGVHRAAQQGGADAIAHEPQSREEV